MRRGRLSLHSPLAVFGRLQASAVGLLFVNLLAAAPACGQIIMGQVIDVGSNKPVVGATLTLADTLAAPQREVLSNSAGRFIIALTAPGIYLLQAGRLGYVNIQSAAIEIGEGEVVEVEVRLAVEAVQIEPLTVVVRRPETQRERDLRGYFERVEQSGESHFGSIQIYTRESLEEWDALSLEELFRFYIRWHPSAGRNCGPRVFIDGQQRNRSLFEIIMVAKIEGIELYPSTGPGQSRFWDPRGCGVVLVWTRVLPEGGRKLGLVEVLALVGAAALVTVQAVLLIF